MKESLERGTEACIGDYVKHQVCHHVDGSVTRLVKDIHRCIGTLLELREVED